MIDIDSLLTKGNDLYYRLANPDGKVWVLPTRHMATGLQLYQPSGWKGRALKRFLPNLHRVPGLLRGIHATRLRAALRYEIVDMAERVFGTGDLEYSIFGGTPSVHQKVTIQFFQGDRILGYGKVTDNGEVRRLFDCEQKLLDTLHAKGIDDIPRCLLNTVLSDDNAFFLQSTRKTPECASPAGWTQMHENFLRMLHEKTKVNLPFEESDFHESLVALREMLPKLPQKYAEAISPRLSEALAEYGEGRHEFSAYHADFTPWNMFVDGDRLFVFDWEYGRMTYPPMLDKYHFFVQQMMHVGHMSSQEIHECLGREEWYDRHQVRDYLLDIVSRFVCREHGGISDALDGMLQTWCEILILTK